MMELTPMSGSNDFAINPTPTDEVVLPAGIGADAEASNDLGAVVVNRRARSSSSLASLRPCEMRA